MEFAFLIIGIVVGGVIGWLVGKNKKADVVQDNDQLNWLKSELEKTESELKLERDKSTELNSQLASERANLANLKERLETQKKELEELQQKFTEQFENIARKVMMDNSQRFSEEHKKKLDDVLNPFKEKIDKFEKTVSETNESRIKESASLKEQITNLQKLNETIGTEAKNLTLALKGETKTQGNWGEMILERILEKSGLEKGREYETQSSMTNEEGKRLQPDVVIHLPDDKQIIVDSKVSLVAYERYVNAENDTERAARLKEHIGSIKQHIKDLSNKNYQNLYQLNSLDFVLLFIPVEPAFNIAVQQELELYNEAFSKNIVIVSTSTLLATLRTISNIWRQEKQTQNAMEIARQSGDLYDKFVNFVEDLIQLGNRLKTTTDSYENAMKKLYDGRGNLVRRAEKLRELGANTSKSIPQNLLDRAND